MPTYKTRDGKEVQVPEPGQSKTNTSGQDAKDPLKDAQDFARQMAANALIENELTKSKAAANKAEAEAEEAKAKAERAKRGGDEGGGSPLKIKGSVDLGDFNYQDLIKQQSDDLKALKQESDDAAANQHAVSEDLREKLHSKEMELMTTSFAGQMQVLTKMIESNASKGSFMEQYTGMQEISKTLGFTQPQLAGDMTTQMALEKMKFEQTTELRRMAREDKRADREFQRQLAKDADERDAKKVEQAQLQKRDDMFANAPKVLGSALAQGIISSQHKGEGVAEEAAPEEAQVPKERAAEQGRHIDADWGAGGEVECPGCSQPLGIGPTARTAVCANCGESVPIRRVGEKPVA